jgi:transposase
MNAALPDSIEDLKAYASSLASERDELKLQRDQAIHQASEFQTKYEEEHYKYEKLRQLVFGRKSERITEEDPAQGKLFNEAEIENQKEEPILEEAKLEKKRREKRPGSGRSRAPENLERVEVIHDLSDEEKACPCCGKTRPAIGEERSEETALIPAHFVVKVHVRKTYGPCACEGFKNSGEKTVVTAPAPAKIVPGSMFANETIAFSLVSKFVDGLPFYRQEALFGRYGLDLGRGTMARLAVRTASRISDLVERMRDDIRVSPVVRMDETTVQVLKENGRPPGTLSRMWVAMGYRERRPIYFFSYSPSRSGKIAESIVGPYAGYLQTDGYSGYNALGARAEVVHVGCWAHIRREFADIYRSQKSPLALEAITLIRELYVIERTQRAALETGTIDEPMFLICRKADAEKAFENILSWLYARKAELPPQSLMGKAVAYALGQYERAIRYVEHPLLTPDNNLAENAIRPFVIGRKNWMFCDSPAGAWASSTLYSLLITAKANGHEPYRYLCHLFDALPRLESRDELDSLLPYVLKPSEY